MINQSVQMFQYDQMELPGFSTEPLPLQEASSVILHDKRLLPGETHEDMRKRISKTLAKLEKDPEYWEKEFDWVLKYAFPGGRISSNVGAEHVKTKVSLINCTVSRTIEDSMQGIMEAATEAAITLKAGCGIGYDFTTIRPNGALVNGAGAYTNGVLPFMDIFDSVCKTVSSAGGRRGAQMGVLDVCHPDIEAFITAKREDGRLRAFNLSVLISQDFIDAVINDQEWKLIFPAFKSELDHSEIIYKRWPLYDEKYTLNDKEETACRVYRTIKAKKLWDLIMTSTYEFSDPGFLLIDEINKMNPLWFDENIRSTNPCVTGDTWVHTSNGPHQVNDLIGKQTIVRVNGFDYSTSIDGFFKTGVKQTLKIKTNKGYELRLTDNHLVKCIVNTETGITEKWIEAGKLTSGTVIKLSDHRMNTSWEGRGTEEEGYILGLLIGDGTINHEHATLSVWTVPNVVNGSPTGYGGYDVINYACECIRKITGNQDIKGFYEIVGRNEHRIKLKAISELANAYGITRGNKIVTPLIEKTSSFFTRGFLRGLFDADGTIQDTQQKGVNIRLSQSDLETLKSVQRMLLRFGIVSTIYENRRKAGICVLPNNKDGYSEYNCKAQHELVISNSNLFYYLNHVGFNDTEKLDRLMHTLASYMRTPNEERFVDTIESVELDTIEDVYDVQVPGINSFDANGIVAHNCGEQPLPPYGACLLGSINLASMVQNPFSFNASFDYEILKKVVKVFSRMLDNVVEINGLPLPEQRVEINRKRRHGMGYLGLGSAMTMMGIKYGSKESVEFTDRVTKILTMESWRAGLELAKEKGCAPILKEIFTITHEMVEKQPKLLEEGYKIGDKLPGRVLHARFSNYMKKIADEDNNLVEELEKYGSRFTHATSIAPTGTMAAGEGNNASNGIEPSFAHGYIRNMIVPGKKTKESLIMMSYEMLAYKTWVDNNVDPLNPPKWFDNTTSEVSPKSHIDVQAAAQYWVDSSISKTTNVPVDYPFEDFKDIYFYGIEKGLKGCTTFRFNPKVHQGVLVKQDNLENTTYTFELEDGTKITAKGNDIIIYDGERHTAANLFDALKENRYGRY